MSDTETDSPDCAACTGTGFVCESHPDTCWGGICCDGPLAGTCEHGACHCGGAGMPCPACCSPVPEDGTVPVGWAYVPDSRRDALNAALAEREKPR